MKNTHHFLACDIGASSGRCMLATLCNAKLELTELSRFTNKIGYVHNKYYWNIFALYEALKDGLREATARDIQIDAIGIDTWGVDFVYIGADGTILSQPRSYRDPYTNGMPEEYFKLIPKQEVYEATGIQIMNFNSLFQLFAAKQENFSPLHAAESTLFIPDALAYMLTGNKVCEYTIASTSQLLNPKTKTFENKLFEAMDIDKSIMQPILMPGEVMGYVTEAIASECGLSKTPVIAVAGHDTASAVLAVPAENQNFAYLSSGTWSLMGIEVTEPIITSESFAMNFTNEGGVCGTTRFLKNITGMWILEQCRSQWEAQGKAYTYPQIVALSNSVPGFQSLIDPDDASFANPTAMTEAIVAYCERTQQKAPVLDAEFIRCIFDSLAFKYKYVLECLQKVAPFPIEKLHVIGGGSNNKLLNQLTANAIGIPVVAGPSEATAIGNALMQAKGIGLVGSLDEMRAIVRNSFTTEVYEPQDVQLWNEQYPKFLNKIR